MTTTGKWLQREVPRRGWTYVDMVDGVEDLGEPAAVCEMCEVKEIRYVHYLEHPDYPKQLGVGRICAEHMLEDCVGPRLREERLRRYARRRRTWGDREWRISQHGNPYLNIEGFNLVVYPEGSAWCVQVTNRTTDQQQRGNRLYPTKDAAQAGALVALLWAKEYLNE